MPTNYPAAIDELENPTSGSYEDTLSHAGQHANANDAIEALEAKVGKDSSDDATSLDYLLKSTESVDPGHTHTEAKVAFDETDGHNHDGVNSAPMPKFWANVYITGITLGAAGTATLKENPAYEVTVRDPNTTGFKTTAAKYAIMGGFDFVATRTKSYKIDIFISGIRIQSAGGVGMAGVFRVTQDTSAPEDKDENTSDTGTTVAGSILSFTMKGSGWQDSAAGVIRVVVDLVKDTHYYFTLQGYHTGPEAATVMDFPLTGQGTSMYIEELSVV